MIFAKASPLFTKLSNTISYWMANLNRNPVCQRHPGTPAGSGMYGLLVPTDTVQGR